MKRITIAKTTYPNILGRYIDLVFNMDTTKNKKYAEYILSIINSKKISNIREVRSIIENILKFESLLPYIDKTERNIYSPMYRNYSVLCDRIKYYTEVMEQKIFDKNKDLHREVLFEDDNFLFIYVKSHEGSTKYGRGTKWCITDQKVFTRYNTYNCFYFLINKSDDIEVKKNYKKLAFVLPRKKLLPVDSIRIYNTIDNITDHEKINRYSNIDSDILFNVHISMITHLHKLFVNNSQTIKNKKKIVDNKFV